MEYGEHDASAYISIIHGPRGDVLLLLMALLKIRHTSSLGFKLLVFGQCM
jgi:hypothetical protein